MARRPAVATPLSKTTCATRLFKNLRRLQRAAPQLVPKPLDPEAFGKIAPLETLAALHKQRAVKDSGSPVGHLSPELATALQAAFPTQPDMQGALGPLFKGTLHFVQMQFTITNQGNAVVELSAADLGVAVAYAQRAIGPISAYASQYGPNNLAVAPNVISYPVTLPSPSYTGDQLRGWVDAIAATLPADAAVVIMNPAGVTHSGIPGYLGYHAHSTVPYIWSMTSGQNWTVDDRAFQFAGVLSHEIAELTVDPLANDSNPEVCDGCAGNCGNWFAAYFDAGGNYLETLETLPPTSLQYAFFINSIIQPAYAGACPGDPMTACSYPPPRVLPHQRIAFELTARWYVELWLMIHGGDPGPLDLRFTSTVRDVATIRAIASLAACLDDTELTRILGGALEEASSRMAAQLRESLLRDR